MTVFGSRLGKNTRATEIEWTSPATNLWVATENGEYAGMVEFVTGHFTVRSSTGSPVAECTSIPAAQAALARHLASPVSVARAALNQATARAFLGRVPRPTYLRGGLAA
ncbi:MAG: hypothetical protein ABWY68_00475 [Cryobacterium sp.]